MSNTPLPPRPNNRRIQTTALDFDGIKENIKEFLRGQDTFSDYDFEGSGLSVLLDVLAYNTHYNALYTNLAINEAFIDSASKRNSVVSRAKELGYTPQSSIAATAVVDLVIVNNTLLNEEQSISIPIYTPFNTTIDGVPYTFYTLETRIAYKQDNQFSVTDITIKEGTPLLSVFTIGLDTKITLPNQNVDLSTLRVTVQENNQTSAIRTFVNSASVLNVDGDSEVYFVKEIENGLYELEFGNNVVGKKLDQGNVVTVSYLSCNQDAPNGARTFVYNGALATNSQSIVTTTTPAYGGSPPEDVDTVKWNAPRAYTAQNRCITIEDYRTVIRTLYPNARSINVWGGETNFPPTYGDVYISIKPENGETLLQGEKDYILNDILGPRKAVTIHPKFVDPTYIGVELDVTFYYDRNLTTRSPQDLVSLIRDRITEYNDVTLNQFNGIFKHSFVSRLIDESEVAIKSNITTLKLHRDVDPVFDQAFTYIIDLGNPVYNSEGGENSIYSNEIDVIDSPYQVYIIDESSPGSDTGIMKMYYNNATLGTKVFVKNVGTVRYSKGIIELKDLIITGLTTTEFKFVIKPQSYDVVSAKNQIVNIIPELLKITPRIDGDSNNYVFTPSRD